MGCWPLVQTKGSRGAVEVEDARQVVEWCELEKFHPLGMEMEVVWQVVDCFAPETQTLGPLGKNTFVLMIVSVLETLEVARLASCLGMQRLRSTLQCGELGVFRKILKLFGHFAKALDWVCGFSKRLGFKSSFGLKCKVGDFVAGRMIKRYKAALNGF
jgi:hypothetical protein